MTNPESRDLEKRLATPPPVPEPPEDLLAKLRAEIPEELPRPRLDESVAPSPRRWQLAAVLAMTLLGGGVGYWVTQQAPPLSTAQSESELLSDGAAREDEAKVLQAEGSARPGASEPSASEAGPAEQGVLESESFDTLRFELRAGEPVADEAPAAPEAAAGQLAGVTGESLADVPEGQGSRSTAAPRDSEVEQALRQEKKRRTLRPPGDPAPGDPPAGEPTAGDPTAELGKAESERLAGRAVAPEPTPVQEVAPPPSPRAELRRPVPPPSSAAPRPAPPPPPRSLASPSPRSDAPARRLRESEASRKQKDDELRQQNASIERDNDTVRRLEEEQARLEKEFEAQFAEEIVIDPPSPKLDESLGRDQAEGEPRQAPPSTGGSAEPNGQPVGDMFFEHSGVNPFLDSSEDALSTFALDVDRASFTLLRRYLDGGNRPPAAAIRVEEIVNALDRGDRAPVDEDFRWTAEGAHTPFTESDAYRLLRFRMAAREVERPAMALTLVIDVSGSMSRGGRLDLVRRSLELLLDRLQAGDRVSLVTFGQRARVVLEATSDGLAVRRALAALEAGGSTHAEAGLSLAYEVALEHLRPGTINRVVLCSDGVANVGATDAESLLETIARGREAGIELTALGFGMGNYNDVLLERLANRGDGTYGYIDSFAEARELLADGLGGTLLTVAEDARVQVELDPAVIDRYRLLGYENRDLADEDFRNTASDGGEIGSGHRVTALYEVRLRPGVAADRTAATLTFRYRAPRDQRWREQTVRVTAGELETPWEDSSADFRQAALAAELAEILRGSFWAREGDLAEVARRARSLVAERPENPEAIELARLAARAATLGR